jgi:energy-coupling factor transport system ATP-binding protein
MSIEIEKLSYVYMQGTPFEKTALNNVNLSISDGEFLGIIGHTGSGKSTLIQHLNGLIKPTSGRVLIDGLDTSSKDLKELRKHVGIVFQYPEHQLFEETVYKDIAFGLKKNNVPDEQVKREIYEVIQAVGLPEKVLEKSPFELSGGQKRRVAIAGVLVMKPGILVLDEPTAGLDPKGRDELFSFITQIHKKLGMTIILVSHSMEDVARLVDRVIVMNSGHVEIDGSVADVFADFARLEQIGLSAPQVAYLMKDLKNEFPEFDDHKYTVSAARDEIIRYLKAEVAKS